MKLRPAAVCALLLVLGTPASAHRLDEYLQAATISVERDRVQVEMRLTPGVAVFGKVFANIDTNADGVLSASEQRAYVEQVQGDLSVTLDGKHLQLRAVSWKYAQVAEMKEGRGDIQLEFSAEAPRGDRNRRLVFENHHQSRIAAYLVNCLVPVDPNIQVTAQHRNYQQSVYELDYVQIGEPSTSRALARNSSVQGWVAAGVLLLFAPLAWLWRRTAAGTKTVAQRPGASACEAVSSEGRGL